MPTYNRADTIERAIRSVQAQTFQDWELIVVDDGSTDDTATRIADLEPRMRLIRQENRGFVGARNTGLSASTGHYIAFLDSDDEWLPHHLELSVAFLNHFPDEQFVASELSEDFGQGRIVNHYRIETSEWYPAIARQLQSPGLDRQPNSDDDYLRVYDSREPIGDWGSEILKRAGIDEEKFLYHGRIFEKLRWGFLIAVNSLVIRKTAIEAVGLQNPTYNLAADYHYMGLLCRNFRANFLGLPTYVKHELTSNGELPASTHIATGTTSFIFGQDMIRSFDNLFWQERKDDPELTALRGVHLFGLAQAALRHGERDAALRYLKEVRQSGNGHYRMLALEGFVRCLPHANLTRKAYTVLNKGTYASKQLLRGELSPLFLLRKMLAQLNPKSLYNNRALLLFLITHLYPIVSYLLSDEIVAASAAASDLPG
jgi:glycosyltransferase involved in cell wall biosynthesis